MKPHKESLAYAEKMRKRERKGKMAITTTAGAISSTVVAAQQWTGGEITTFYWDEMKRGYYPADPVRPLQCQLDEAIAEIADLKSQLAEHKEIIQALAAELGDMEALREENERLKAYDKPSELYGWFENPGSRPPLLPSGASIDVLWCSGDISQNVGGDHWSWHLPSDLRPKDAGTIRAWRHHK